MGNGQRGNTLASRERCHAARSPRSGAGSSGAGDLRPEQPHVLHRVFEYAPRVGDRHGPDEWRAFLWRGREGCQKVIATACDQTWSP